LYGNSEINVDLLESHATRKHRNGVSRSPNWNRLKSIRSDRLTFRRLHQSHAVRRRPIRSCPRSARVCSGRRFEMKSDSAVAQEALGSDFEEIRKSEATLRQVVDTIPALVWSNLADGPNDFSNQRWQDYTGISSEGARG